MEAAPLVLTSAPGNEIRILAGSPRPYTDHLGRSWTPDRFFSGGTLESTSNHPVQGTRDPQIYETRREGTFRYRIPLSPGVYELRLHFAEVIYGESNLAGGGETSRLFNVLINGAVALEALDVIAGAGPNNAHVRVFRDVRPDPDGFLQLQFDSVTGMAFLNAIEITPGIPGQLKPIRILARNQPYVDRHGNLWQADDYHRGGMEVVRPHDVQGAPDPEIYRGERFGNIVYDIPVAPGRYTVTLHFAETWFGPDKPQKGGPGSRSFDVLCNGMALLRDFDIYKEAGGSDRALTRTFRGLEASPQGKLVLSFVPKRNYACINAIEVLSEPDVRK